ncbi:Ig-like domain-containing protein [Candidatus Saganbacteria bacterium]|nr:Ig-like domain-containing protein [Candidatus Saganbacteria bacterium]
MKKLILIITLFVICHLSFVICANAAIISNEELTTITDSSFIVTWTTTDEASTTEIEYGIGNFSSIVTVEGATKYHYAVVSGLNPNNLYSYRVKSGSSKGPNNTATTLSKPTGDYLFSFAVLNDIRYAEGKAATVSGRGSPYNLCQSIVTSEVSDINAKGVAFTVINGNLAESSNAYGDQIGTNLKTKLDSLNGASDLPNYAFKYLAVPGYQDKKATFTTDWITNGFKLLTDPVSLETHYGYNAASKDANSVLNYSFAYNHYNFVFLDSVKKPSDASGHINTDIARNLITTEAIKTFVFSSFPCYDFRSVSVNGSTLKDYPLTIPTVEGGVVVIDNDTAFRSTIEAIKDTNGYPLVAAVISGHITDNYKRDINNISYVRQGPAVQFPTGYSIYKIYTNGYIKSFYKTIGRDSNDKPFYESARDSISSEGVVPKEFLESFWLGSSSLNNFTYTYPYIPGAPPAVRSNMPTSGESGAPLNKPIVLTFNKRMSTSNPAAWVSISPSVGTLTANFDSSNTILTISHPNFTIDTTYTVTVLKSNVLDEGSSAMDSNYVFSFNTNSSSIDATPPTVSVTPLPSNTTTDLLPTLNGISTDESGVANVEFRVDSGSFISAEAVDGAFNSTNEAFYIRIPSALSRGSHTISIRTTDAAGNITTSSFSTYSFTVAQSTPTISVRINGVKPYPGDPLSPTPKIEITVNTINGPPTGSIKINSSKTNLTFANVDTNYYSTFETAAPLSDGSVYLIVEAFDTLGNGSTYEVTPIYVQSSKDLVSQGTPLSYPNPFDPQTETTSISYLLSKASSITLTIHDLSGNLISKKSYSSTQNGGIAGYNEVSWDGKSDAGQTVGTGTYVYLIIGGGKVIGKGKITAVKR